MKNYKNIDEYISGFSGETRKKLEQIRKVVREVAPEATEKISYGIPTFYLNGNLVHFGGFKDHVSFFPTSYGVAAFKEELSGYETSKGTIKFPLDKPLPLDLIRKITQACAERNLSKKK
jgi:uncharacterized protein YdhG (YjbR/CyaY superfamily)